MQAYAGALLMLIVSSSGAVATVSAISVALTSVVVAADKGKEDAKKARKVSPKVATALQAANEAMKKKDFETAAKKLQEADAFGKKTPFDQWQIDEFKAWLYSSQNTNFSEIITIYERSLATPEYLEPDAAEMRLKQLSALHFNTQNYPKSIEYGKRWLEKHSDDQAMVVLVGKAQYLSKDYAGTLQSMKSAVSLSEAAGKVPEEQWLLLISSSASQIDDQPTVVWGYEKLARYYPKPDAWAKLLERALRAEGSNELALLNVFRLMDDTSVLARADQYQEYAQLAVEKAMPGEALRALEAGFQKNVLGATAKDKVNQQRQLDEVKKRATADKASLPESEKEARGAKGTGQLMAGLGLAYFSFGMYPEAVAALDAGIKKGGLKNVDDYRLALGIAQLKTGQKDAARAEFQQIAATSPLSNVAKLWTIRTYNP